MLKKSFTVMSVAAVFFASAQNVSTVKNSVDIYSNAAFFGSAKYNAMAGSTGALGGDGNSLLNNPAGLGVAISSDISGTLSVQNNKNVSSLNGSSIDYTINTADIGNVNGVAAFQLMTESPWKFVNIGMSYSNQTIEDYVETPGNSNIIIQKALVDAGGNDVTGNLSYLGHAYNRFGNQSKMSVGVGANYANFLYLGAGLNFHYAQIEQYDTARFGLDLDNTVSTYDKQYTPFTEESGGFSATFGVIGKVNNQFRLGAALETPTWWSIQRFYNENYVDNSGFISYETLEESRNFSSPLKANLSASFVPNKNFSLNVDYSLGLTKPRYRVEGAAESELNDFFDDNYKNLSEVKFGAEYRVKALRFRGGYSFATNPFDAVSISSYSNTGVEGNTSYDQLFTGKRNTLGLGIGYAFTSLFIDAAFQNTVSEYSNPFLRGSEEFGTGYYSADFDVNSNSSVVSQVKNTRNNFFLTVGWKF
ncbi:MAG: hemin receptor [Kaistella sp.]|nr:hemin receptor [Kaistella sp.]